MTGKKLDYQIFSLEVKFYLSVSLPILSTGHILELLNCFLTTAVKYRKSSMFSFMETGVWDLSFES